MTKRKRPEYIGWTGTESLKRWHLSEYLTHKNKSAMCKTRRNTSQIQGWKTEGNGFRKHNAKIAVSSVEGSTQQDGGESHGDTG